ncbi:HET-domain-containing protein, partial [Amniculicola lignicola CBS 123094]
LEPFSYQPIDSANHQVRLLRILPEAEREERGRPKPIQCEIFHAHLHPQTRFTALSYTWGPPGELPVSINRYVFHVGENLHGALAWLRGHRQPNRYLWIDAICINQRDTAEKSQQVAMMGQIYTSAEDVLIWLG